MNPNDRELLALEPELRRPAVRKVYPLRRTSRRLAIFLTVLRVYVICSLVLVLMTFVRVLHR